METSKPKHITTLKTYLTQHSKSQTTTTATQRKTAIWNHTTTATTTIKQYSCKLNEKKTKTKTKTNKEEK